MDLTTVYRQAETLISLKKYKIARTLVQKNLHLDNDTGQLYHLLGKCYIYEKRYVRSEEALKIALKKDAIDPFIQIDYALVLINLFRLKEAEELLIAVVASSPNIPLAHCHLGRIKFRMNAEEESLTHLNRALTLDPTHQLSLELKAHSLMCLGRVEEAERILKLLMQNTPNQPLVLANMGFLALKRGDFNNARQFFRMALQVAPDYQFALRGYKTAIEPRNIIHRRIAKVEILFLLENRVRLNAGVYAFMICFFTSILVFLAYPKDYRVILFCTSLMYILIGLPIKVLPHLAYMTKTKDAYFEMSLSRLERISNYFAMICMATGLSMSLGSIFTQQWLVEGLLVTMIGIMITDLGRFRFTLQQQIFGVIFVFTYAILVFFTSISGFINLFLVIILAVITVTYPFLGGRVLVYNKQKSRL